MLAPPAAQGAEELAGCAAVAAPACNAQGSTAPGPEQFPREQAFEQQHAAAQEQSAQRQNPDVLAAAAPRQAAAAGDSSGGGGGSKGLAADDEEGQEGEGFDAELGTWLTGRLQRMQPGAELDHGSVRVLGRLLDELAARVLDEACRVNAASAAHADADAAVAGGTESGPAAQAGGGGDDEHEAQRRQKLSTLTSLDIHKALKRVLPGEPSDGKLRPYLPAVTKKAWHLDKQSLKGIKRQKQAVAAGGAAAAATVLAAGSAGSKENAQPHGPAE